MDSRRRLAQRGERGPADLDERPTHGPMPSDRQTELAALIEDQSARCTPDPDWDPLLARRPRPSR